MKLINANGFKIASYKFQCLLSPQAFCLNVHSMMAPLSHRPLVLLFKTVFPINHFSPIKKEKFSF